MRFLTGISALLFCVAASAYAEDAAPADATSESAAEKERVQFEGQDLVLSWQEQDVFGNRIKEFIPAEETLERWTRLASVFEYPQIDSPREFAEGMIEQLKKREPPANYELLANDETGDVLLDFIVWPDDASYAEFNVFQFRKNDAGGITAYQYALRGYGDDKEQFISDLQADRRAELIAALLTGVAEMNGEENAVASVADDTASTPADAAQAAGENRTDTENDASNKAPAANEETSTE